MSLLQIAEILRPQGIKGELKLRVDIDAEFFSRVKEVFVDGENSPREIIAARVYGGHAYIFLQGIISRNHAELMRGKKLSVPKEVICPQQSGVYLISDMIGCRVFIQDSGKDCDIGVITDILQHGAADVIEVKIADGKTMMFPYLQDVVLSVDISQKAITVDGHRLSQVCVCSD